jgi:methylmalonyl-CoA/ethylmalonyl-CoA epimerase
VLQAIVSAPVNLPEHGVITVFVDLGNTKIELLHPLGENSPITGFLHKNPAGGIHHFCIEVEDIQAADSYLKEQGVRVLGSPKPGAHGANVLFLHPKDCMGCLVELEETK